MVGKVGEIFKDLLYPPCRFHHSELVRQSQAVAGEVAAEAVLHGDSAVGKDLNLSGPSGTDLGELDRCRT